MAILEQPPVPGQQSGVLEHIRAILSGLPPAERRIADHILADPGKAITLSINEFAAFCGVAQPTVSKFCRNIGISSYAALRLGLSHDFAAQPPDKDRSAPPPSTLITAITSVITTLRSHADLPLIAHELLTAPHVDIWSSPEFMATGTLLADRFMASGILATSSLVPVRWTERGASLRPGSVVILLTSSLEEIHLPALARAWQAGARLLCCAVRVSRPLIQVVDWLIPLPDNSSLELTGFALVETLLTAIQEAEDLPGPQGPASPWRLWPSTRTVFLPTDRDPIPAILLTHEDPPRPRPLIFYFTGLNHTKEEALPGLGGTHNPVCPRIIAALLNTGYHVLVVDALAHGMRKRAWEDTLTLLLESLSGAGTDVLAAARADAPFLVDGARTLDVTGEKMPIGVVGQSWGGLQALYTLASDSRIACGVAMMPVIHIPATLDQEPALRSKEGFTTFEGLPRVVDGEPGAWMGPHLAPRPLLLLAGEKDTIAPSHYTRAFAEDLQPAYTTAAGNLECKILPGVRHEYSRQMLEETLAWLARHLPAPTSEQAGLDPEIRYFRNFRTKLWRASHEPSQD